MGNKHYVMKKLKQKNANIKTVIKAFKGTDEEENKKN